MKNWQRFIKENIEIIDQYNIEIEKFDEEITQEEKQNLDRRYIETRFDNKEIMKLNLYFGILKKNNIYYQFKLNYGGFGKEKVSFSGVIYKKNKHDKGKLINEYCYLIDGWIKIKFGNDKGERQIYLKFDAFDNLIEFFDTMEEKIKLNI